MNLLGVTEKATFGLSLLTLTTFLGLYWWNPSRFQGNGSKFAFAVLVFCILVCLLYAYVLNRRKELVQRLANPKSTSFAHAFIVAFVSIPCIAMGIMILVSPLVTVRSVTIDMYSSLIPLAVLSILYAFPPKFHDTLRGKTVAAQLAYWFFLLVITVILLDTIKTPPSKGPASVNSVDKSYWYYQPTPSYLRKGVQLRINSWGFRGPEPAASDLETTRVIVIGDSMPFGGDMPEDKIFPSVAEQLLNQRSNYSKPIKILNASIPGYSTEQIKNFYVDHLKGLDHELVIMCFYLDDVNRDRKYKKNSFLYSPFYPEWLQDLYYSTFSANFFMTHFGYSAEFFWGYRKLSFEAAWPRVFEQLNDIHAEALKRGAQLGIFNLPVTNWKHSIKDEKDYIFSHKNGELEKWARARHIPYHDTLPVFLNRNILDLTKSSEDHHYNESGHHLVGRELRAFLERIIEQ